MQRNETTTTTSMWYMPGKVKQATPEQVTLVVLPGMLSVLSLICTYASARESLVDLFSKPKMQRQATTKICVSMNVAFFIYFFGNLWGPIPSPVQLEQWGPIGTFSTCSAQGFLRQWGVCSATTFVMILTWFYAKIVLHRWNNDRLNRLFPWLNHGTWIVSFVAALVPAVMGYYNSTGASCWVQTFPYGCSDEETYRGDTPCLRGINAWIPRLALRFVPYIPVVFIVLILYIRMYRSVRRVEDRASQYAGSASRQMSGGVSPSATTMLDQSRHTNLDVSSMAQQTAAAPSTTASTVVVINRSKSNAVFRQAALYCCTYLLGVVVTTAAFVAATIIGYYPFWVDLIAELGYASPGFLMFIALAVPRTEMKTVEGRLVRRLLFGCCCCCCRCCGRKKSKQELEREEREEAAKKRRRQGMLSSLTLDGSHHQQQQQQSSTFLTASAPFTPSASSSGAADVLHQQLPSPGTSVAPALPMLLAEPSSSRDASESSLGLILQASVNSDGAASFCDESPGSLLHLNGDDPNTSEEDESSEHQIQLAARSPMRVYHSPKNSLSPRRITDKLRLMFNNSFSGSSSAASLPWESEDSSMRSSGGDGGGLPPRLICTSITNSKSSNQQHHDSWCEDQEREGDGEENGFSTRKANILQVDESNKADEQKEEDRAFTTVSSIVEP